MKAKNNIKKLNILIFTIVLMILSTSIIYADTININDFVEDKNVSIIDLVIEKERKRKYGIIIENDGKYMYDKDGNLLTDYLYKTNKGNIYYSNGKGKCVTNTWVVVSPGNIKTNISFNDTKTRTLYFSNTCAAYKNATRLIDGVRYNFDKDGYLVDDDAFENMGIKNDDNINVVLKEKEIGDVVYFGEYVQSKESEEKILWQILDKTDEKALLVSSYILDCKNFDDEGKNVWETSSIRKWLNNTFLYWAFKEDEDLDSIIESDIVTDGNITSDKIFLLSSEEIIKYFGNEDSEGMNKKSASMATNNARDNGIFVSEREDEWYNGNSSYYLRDIAIEKNNVKCVGVYGHLYNEGEEPKLEYGDGIRPAMWVKITN